MKEKKKVLYFFKLVFIIVIPPFSRLLQLYTPNRLIMKTIEYHLLFTILLLFRTFTCSILTKRIDFDSLPSAKSEVPLDNGMSVIAQFIQYPDHLTYALYLNNQANYPYWNNSGLCLAWVVGTPSLLVDSTHQCSFINTTGSCTPKIPRNPCETMIDTSQCNSVELFSGKVRV
jgi:hypothetical protein